MRILPLLLCCAAAHAAPPGPLVPAGGNPDILVDRFDDPEPDGCSAGSCSLREAVALANARGGLDRIVLPAGTFQLVRAGAAEDMNLTGDLDIEDDLEIAGAGPDATVVLQLTDDRLLHSFNAPLIVRGVRLDGGHGVQEGGAIFAESARLRIEDSEFRNNTASLRGGAVSHSAATQPGMPPALSMLRGRFEDNRIISPDPGYGGALSAHAYGTSSENIRIEDCSFIENDARSGGGAVALFGANAAGERGATIVGSDFVGNNLYSPGSIGAAVAVNVEAPGKLVVRVRDSRFEDNGGQSFADSYGGAIGMRDGHLDVATSVFVDNVAGRGGAIDVANATAGITTSTLCDNSAGAAGGAIRSTGDLAVADSTLCRNTVTSTLVAHPGGGAIAASARLDLRNTTFDGNSALRGGALAVSNGPLFLVNNTLRAGPQPAGALGSLLRYTAANAGAGLEFVSTLLMGTCSYSVTGVAPSRALYSLDTSNHSCKLSSAGIQTGNSANVDESEINLAPLDDHGGPTHTRPPLAPSLAIDNGSDNQCLPRDQRGYVRPAAGCDIGAVEVGALPPADAMFADGFETVP